MILNKILQDDLVEVVLKDAQLDIKASTNMTHVKVFDLMGRLILDSKINVAKTFNTSFFHPQAVYIAKVTLDNGKTATQ